MGNLYQQVRTWESLCQAWRKAAQDMRGEDLSGFLRLTCGEYLAARAAAMAGRVDWEHTIERVLRHLEASAWREVIRLVDGQLDSVEARRQAAAVLVGAILDAPEHSQACGQHALLAGLCLADVGQQGVAPACWERAVRALVRAMQDTAPDGRPHDPPLVPIAARYATAEVLDRLGWLPPNLDAWVEVQISDFYSPTVYVARYPLTNAQFERFIAAGGYENPGYWGGEEGWGWRWRVEAHPGYRREGPVTRPEYWDHPRLGQERRGYPVVGVSWYEALAYCRWLGKWLRIADRGFQVWRGGQLETLDLRETAGVRLLTEEEWVAAAGGFEGGRYPWGPEWHASRANTREGGIGGTTPVAMYPSGQSPWGVWDMGGNVWEWTMSADDEEQRRSILRCGSWLDVHRLARVAVRGWYFPAQSYHYVGFRVAIGGG